MNPEARHGQGKRLREILRSRIINDLASRDDPLWREIAYWGVLVSFFSLPLLVFLLHFVIVAWHLEVKAHVGEFAYLWSFHRILAGLLAALMGLNSWDKRIKNGKNGNGTP